jgi:hypothetical protein
MVFQPVSLMKPVKVFFAYVSGFGTLAFKINDKNQSFEHGRKDSHQFLL